MTFIFGSGEHRVFDEIDFITTSLSRSVSIVSYAIKVKLLYRVTRDNHWGFLLTKVLVSMDDFW